MVPPQREAVYRAALRLIEKHGDAAELAAILRDDPTLCGNEEARQAVLDAIAELRSLATRTKPN